MTDLTPAAQALLDDYAPAPYRNKLQKRLLAIQAEARASAEAEIKSFRHTARMARIAAKRENYEAYAARLIDDLLAATPAEPREPEYFYQEPDNGEAHSAISTAEPEPTRSAQAHPTELLRHVLQSHYVTAIDCDHDAATDTVRCSCSVWTGSAQSSVGAAVAEWVDHVALLAATPAEPSND